MSTDQKNKIGGDSDLVKLETDLLEYTGPDKVISFAEKKEELDRAPKTGRNMLSCIPSLDTSIKGFNTGELIILSGPTKNGKTLFAQTLTRNFDGLGHKSLWFSYELPPAEFLGTFKILPDAYLPMELLNKSPEWLFNRCYESKLKFGTRAVFIDHLHYLIDMEKIRNPSLEIGSLVRKIKQMAIKLNLVVFLICHIAKMKLDTEPTEADLRDSSFIAQDADSTFMIWRKKIKGMEEFGNEARLVIRNHRRTGVMGKKIDLVKISGFLEEEKDVEIPF